MVGEVVWWIGRSSPGISFLFVCFRRMDWIGLDWIGLD